MKSAVGWFLGSSTLLNLASAQFTLTEVLARYPQLSKLTALITNSTTLSTRFFDQATNFTLLAPTDTAITTWLSKNVSQSSVEAVLLYHLLDGRHPIASIPNSSVAILTALTNQTYANVTGGQRVEALNTGVVEFQSDAKAVSNVVTGDIVGNEGFIHIIDKVLEIPSIFGVAAYEANLTYLIDLVDEGNYLQNTTYSWDIASRRDSTYFAPNSAVALTHVPPNGNQSTYNALLEYHCISQLVYSTDLINGTELPTFNGGKVLITVDEDGTIYANTAKVIGTDYLVFNGVMHILDDLMDPKNMSRTPTTSSTATSSPASPSTALLGSINALSLAAKTGIGVSVGAIAIMSLLGLFLFYRRRRKHRSFLSAVGSQNRMSMYEMNGNAFPEVRELDATEPPVELQASPRSRQETGDSSSDILGSPSSSTTVELPVYPCQQVNEDQEPKSLNQVLERGGVEPKSLSTPQDRPRRPNEIPQRPP